MRHYFFLPLLALIFSCRQSDTKTITVSGKLDNAPNTAVYLELIDFESNLPVVVDSVTMKNGVFELNANTKEESLFQVRFSEEVSGITPVFLISDEDQIQIKGDWKEERSRQIEHSPASNRFRKLLDSLSQLQQNLYDLQGQLQFTSDEQPSGLTDSLTIEFNKISAQFRNYIQNFSEKDESPILSLYATSMLISDTKPEELEAALNRLQKRFPKHAGVAAFIEAQRAAGNRDKKRAEAADRIKEGANAPDVTLPDVEGKPLSISSFKGKYLLVDFWASWCGPCRDENPTVVAAFKKYKDKNFTILGISLDKDKDSWLQAIKDDKLTWSHISDIKGWESEAATVYGIESIPFNVLLDPTGKIIATNLRGEELERKLAELIVPPSR